MVCLLGDSIFRVGKITTFLGKNYRLVNSKNRKQSPRGVLRKNYFVKFSFISEKWGGFLFKIMLHAWHRSFIKKKKKPPPLLCVSVYFPEWLFYRPTMSAKLCKEKFKFLVFQLFLDICNWQNLFRMLFCVTNLSIFGMFLNMPKLTV